MILLKILLTSIFWNLIPRASEVVLVVENPRASAGDKRDVGSIPGGEDPLKEEMATHSSILAWKIPWTEKSGGLQSVGSQRVRQK